MVEGTWPVRVEPELASFWWARTGEKIRQATQILEKRVLSQPVAESTDGLAVEMERARKALGRVEWDVATMT
jgi:hypothetical protein